jgi:hypothetical protein
MEGAQSGYFTLTKALRVTAFRSSVLHLSGALQVTDAVQFTCVVEPSQALSSARSWITRPM